MLLFNEEPSKGGIVKYAHCLFNTVTFTAEPGVC